MAKKDEALRQKKLRRERGEEDFEDLRGLGNVHYRAGQWAQALASYSRSIELDSSTSNMLAFANRAMVHLKMQQYEEVIQDATKALALDRNHVKSLHRRATAYLQQGMQHAALRDLERALLLQPDNRQLRLERKRLQKKMATLAPIEVLSSSSSSSPSHSSRVVVIEEQE